MPTYKYIKKLWTAEEMKENFGIRPKVSSYKNGDIIKEYYKIKEEYKVVTSDIMKKESGICIESIRSRFGSWNKFLIFLGEEPARKINKVTYTNKELIRLYRKISIKAGKEIYGATFSDFIDYVFFHSKSG